jgi:hypothetical protein
MNRYDIAKGLAKHPYYEVPEKNDTLLAKHRLIKNIIKGFKNYKIKANFDGLEISDNGKVTGHVVSKQFEQYSEMGRQQLLDLILASCINKNDHQYISVILMIAPNELQRD